jgi:hypothetical protein
MAGRIYGVVHPRSHAIGVVALDERDRLLLVGQYRYTLGGYSLEIPEVVCRSASPARSVARNSRQPHADGHHAYRAGPGHRSVNDLADGVTS